MTTVVRLAQPTRRLHHAWTGAAIVCFSTATGLAIAAGGDSLWLRFVLCALCVERCAAAVHHRAGLTASVVAAVLAIALLPDDATLDRTMVSAVGAVAIIAGAESAHVARRLITVAPVVTTRRDLAAVVTTAGLGALGVLAAIATAQVDRWIGSAVIAGLVLAAGALVVLTTGRRSADE